MLFEQMAGQDANPAAVTGADGIGLWRVVVALAVELSCTGEIELGLEVFGNGLVHQRALGLLRLVELGLGRCCPGRGRRTVARLVVPIGSAA